MSTVRPVTIVGGGLAGLTLGIGLRQSGIPVTLHEAGHYPRHRVCGEFISGSGQATLARLDLLDLFTRHGVVPAQTAAFFSAKRGTEARPLPATALCLSRFELDAALAKMFQDLGGELLSGSRFTGAFDEGIVRATGRRPQSTGNGARWFGLKIHARRVPLTADLEMHVSPAGYVGLCRINDHRVNICGLFRASASTGQKIGRDSLLGPPNSPLRERLATAEFDDASFCAVAGLSLRPHSAAARNEVCIGDAITMIPPVTGNGMSMAFESAELALTPLLAWSRGEMSWEATREKISRECDAAFARRLRWAKWLQRLILTPALQSPLLTLATHSDRLWRAAFEHTR